MSTLLLPSEDPNEVVDAPRGRIWLIVGGVVVGIMLLVIMFMPRSKPGPAPAGTPTAASQPAQENPLEFAVPAKPPLIQRSPEAVAATTGSPSPDAPIEDMTNWAARDGVVVYGDHGLNKPVVRTLARGERVLWIEAYQNWSHVKLLGGGEGWVPTRDLVASRPDYALNQSPQEGTQCVVDFYNEINRKDYASAYNRLSNEWKAELKFDDFQKGYEEVRDVSCQVHKTEVVSPTQVRVLVILEADEEKKPRRFRGTYTAEYFPIYWKLTSGILEEVEATGTNPTNVGL